MWLSENAACDRCIVSRRHAKCAADFFAMAAGLSDEPSPQQPSAMDTSTDPPSLKDDRLER
jgi:hypothetical protein